MRVPSLFSLALVAAAASLAGARPGDDYMLASRDDGGPALPVRDAHIHALLRRAGKTGSGTVRQSPTTATTSRHPAAKTRRPSIAEQALQALPPPAANTPGLTIAEQALSTLARKEKEEKKEEAKIREDADMKWEKEQGKLMAEFLKAQEKAKQASSATTSKGQRRH